MHAVTMIVAWKLWRKRCMCVKEKSEVKKPDFTWSNTTKISIIYVYMQYTGTIIIESGIESYLRNKL